MALPTPADFDALRVTASSPVCEVLANYVRAIDLMAQLVSSIYNPDGSFTQEFIDKICASGCGGGGTATSTTGATSSASFYFTSRYLDGGIYKGRFFYGTAPGFTFSTINGSMTEAVLGLAVRPSDGVTYCIYMDMTNDSSPFPLRLGTISVSDGTITPIDIINSGGSDWSDTFPYDKYSLEFSSGGILYMSYWEPGGACGGASSTSKIYTVNLTSGEVTALGTSVQMDSSANYFYVFSLAFDASGTMYGMGFNGATNSYSICSINLTPNPSFGNALLATEQCSLLTVASVPCVDATIYQGLVCKNGKKYVWARATGDIYQMVDGTTCGASLVATGTSAMAGITSTAGVPS